MQFLKSITPEKFFWYLLSLTFSPMMWSWGSGTVPGRIGLTDEENMNVVESRCMGRPKKDVDAVSMRLEEDAYELARQAAAIFKESIVVYASRIVRERAAADLLEDARRRIAATEKPAKEGRKGTK